MKTKQTLSTFLLVIYFLTNCSTDTKNKHEVVTFDNFPVTNNLSHEKINTEPNLYCAGGLLLLDSILVSIDLKADTFFQIFRLPHFEYLGGFMTRGPGPDEEIYIDPFIGRVSNNKFLYKGMSSIKIVEYNNQINKLEIHTQIDFPTDLLEMWNIIKLGDSIIGNKSFGLLNKEFIGFDMKHDKIFDFGGGYPLVNKDIDPLLKDRVFAKASVLKSDDSLIATVYDKFPILRIYTNTGEIKKEIRLNNGQSFPNALIEETPNEHSINEIMQNYRVIKSSNSYIYALYIGKKEHELPKGLNDFSNEIHVWNWEGEPVKKILLDEKIFAFDVDSNDNYIIASSLISLDALYKYDLKKGGYLH